MDQTPDDAAKTAQGPETDAAAGSAARAPRQDSRRETVLEAAAELFAAKGFDGVSMRDIAKRAGMLSGSLYYHFPSKDDLFAEVHSAAVARVTARLDAALAAAPEEPWARLEAALLAHLEGLLDRADAVAVLSPHFPTERADLARRLAAQRDAYEDRIRALVAACGPREGLDPRLFRLFLLGALNWTPVWWRPGRGADLAEVARALTDLMRRGAEPPR
jgi:AcrR family transcriptional regulator